MSRGPRPVGRGQLVAAAVTLVLVLGGDVANSLLGQPEALWQVAMSAGGLAGCLYVFYAVGWRRGLAFGAGLYRPGTAPPSGAWWRAGGPGRLQRWWRRRVNWVRRLLGLPRRCRPIPCPPFVEASLWVGTETAPTGDGADPDHTPQGKTTT